jgi:hypothetical protein
VYRVILDIQQSARRAGMVDLALLRATWRPQNEDTENTKGFSWSAPVISEELVLGDGQGEGDLDRLSDISEILWIGKSATLSFWTVR